MAFANRREKETNLCVNAFKLAIQGQKAAIQEKKELKISE